MEIKIDFTRYVSDEQYYSWVHEHFRCETIEAELEKEAMRLGALAVARDIKADQLDRIADYYEEHGMKSLAAQTRAKSKMAHAQVAQRIRER